jgi:capsular exopolysaccharide synthesis family protein
VFGDLGSSPGLIGVISPNANGRAPDTNGQANGHAGTKLEESTITALLETPVQGLLLLPSGPTPPNPAELLGSRRMASILTQLSTNADVIVIDSPPLLPVTDAVVLATKSDGVVLVTAINETPRGAVERSKAILDGTGARVLGVVINKSPKETGGYYYHGGYYSDATTKPSEEPSQHLVGR